MGSASVSIAAIGDVNLWILEGFNYGSLLLRSRAEVCGRYTWLWILVSGRFLSVSDQYHKGSSEATNEEVTEYNENNLKVKEEREGLRVEVLTVLFLANQDVKVAAL